MNREKKSLINREANRLAQKLSVEIASIAQNQINLNESVVIDLHIEWDATQQTFISNYADSQKSKF